MGGRGRGREGGRKGEGGRERGGGRVGERERGGERERDGKKLCRLFGTRNAFVSLCASLLSWNEIYDSQQMTLLLSYPDSV